MHGVASAVGVAVGPVLKEDDIGVRGGVDASLFVFAMERYSFDTGDRTRAEVAVRVPLPLGRGIRISPQLGFVPVDYVSNDSGRTDLDFSLTATAELTIQLGGPLWVVIEPLRAEKRFASLNIDSGSQGVSTDDRGDWEWGSWLALRLGW